LPVTPPGGGWCLLVDVQKLGLDCDHASRLLMEKGKIAATPMRNWGSERASAYVRFVYSNEPVHRLKGVRDRIRAAWDI
jgi:N-succinyldiaminopimelate aminotransferase